MLLSQKEIKMNKENTENNSSQKKAHKSWVGFRKELKVLDCTIRDGGLMNNSRFDDAIVKAVYQACVDGGVDYMELGYKNSEKIFSRDVYGAWRFCTENDIKRVLGENKSDVKLAVMADAEKCDYKTDIVNKDESMIDLVRIAAYVHQIPLALDMVKYAHDKGYETTVNLMAISTITERELDESLELIMESEAKTIYLVDSFGSLYSEQIHYMMNKYLRYARNVGKEVGIHAHNNLQLAFSNTIEAIVCGANMVDATFAGLGRGAGNCPIELLIGFLHNPKYRMRPILECVQNHIEPLRKTLGWGFAYPYMTTGFLNRHPGSAIKFNEGAEKENIVAFYDEMLK